MSLIEYISLVLWIVLGAATCIGIWMSAHQWLIWRVKPNKRQNNVRLEGREAEPLEPDQELKKSIRWLRRKILRTKSRFGLFTTARNRLKCCMASVSLPKPKEGDPEFIILLEDGTSVKVRVINIYRW